MRFRIVILIFLQCLQIPDISASECLRLHNADNRTLTSFEVFCDSSNKRSISQIIDCYNARLFKKAEENAQYQALTTYWVRFEIENRCPSELMWMLHLNAQISHAWLYTFVETVQGLVSLPVDSSISILSISNNRILVPTALGQKTICYVKLRNQLSVPISLSNMYLTASKGNQDHWLIHGVLVGMVLGGIFIMLLFGLMTFTQNTQSMFFYYTVYIFFVFLYFIMVSFIGERYVFGHNPWLCFKANILLLIAFIFYFPFVRKVIKNERNVQFDRFLLRPFIIVMQINSIVISIIAFVSEALFKTLFDYSLLIYSTFALIIGICFWRSNKRIGRIILFGLMVMVSSGIASIAFDDIEENYFFNFGIFIELILITYALSLYQKQLEKANKQKELELMNSRYKLESSQRELTQKALQIVAQEQILNNVKLQLEEIHSDSSQTKLTLMHAVSDLDSALRQNSWNDFELYFTEVHPQFYQNLKNAYPTLTSNELRVCALIRLNLNTKQMAEISQKTPKSIEVMRTRIRQKMNLSREENLFDIIACI